MKFKKPFEIDLTDFNKEYNPLFDIDLIFHVRALLNKELEILRVEKLIGPSEDCRVTFYLTRKVLELIYPFGVSHLREIYKLSMVDYEESDEGCFFEIEPLKDDPRFIKCPRCYLYHSWLAAYEKLCDRCCHSLIEGCSDSHPELIGKIKEYCTKWKLDWTKPLIHGRIMQEVNVDVLLQVKEYVADITLLT